jgi:nucleotide-binding universal stress UspA family protein
MAHLVVIGYDGSPDAQHAVLGSVADAVVRDGRSPVLVVPNIGD